MPAAAGASLARGSGLARNRRAGFGEGRRARDRRRRSGSVTDAHGRPRGGGVRGWRLRGGTAPASAGLTRPVAWSSALAAWGVGRRGLRRRVRASGCGPWAASAAWRAWRRAGGAARRARLRSRAAGVTRRSRRRNGGVGVGGRRSSGAGRRSLSAASAPSGVPASSGVGVVASRPRRRPGSGGVRRRRRRFRGDGRARGGSRDEPARRLAAVSTPGFEVGPGGRPGRPVDGPSTSGRAGRSQRSARERSRAAGVWSEGRAPVSSNPRTTVTRSRLTVPSAQRQGEGVVRSSRGIATPRTEAHRLEAGAVGDRSTGPRGFR